MERKNRKTQRNKKKGLHEITETSFQNEKSFRSSHQKKFKEDSIIAKIIKDHEETIGKE